MNGAPMEDVQEQAVNKQYGPYPTDLADLVSRLRYRPGWTFRLVDVVRDPASSHGMTAGGLTFIATTNTVDSYDHKSRVSVAHYFPVPAATYNEQSWLRWLFDCMAQVELHECMEFFTIDRGCDCAQSGDLAHASDCTINMPAKPFAPLHGPGENPYVVHQYATDLQRRTQFTGRVNDV